MPDMTKKRVLITVRTYPVPSLKSIEASCTAGITDNGQWMRLFPVPYRQMDQEHRFSKWDWIDVNVTKAGDNRPESYKLDPNSIQIGQHLGTADGWRARRRVIDPLKGLTMCALRKLRDAQEYPTLGVIRPFRINRLIIQPTSTSWTAAELDRLKQDDLFLKAPAKILEKIPFDFKYDFHCGDMNCTGHTMMCTDWEMGEAYRRWRDDYGADWEKAFRNKFETEMIERFDTHFFIGTVHQHPGSWIIVGLFYPPKREADLFDAI
jgi:hypothetical protein